MNIIATFFVTLARGQVTLQQNRLQISRRGIGFLQSKTTRQKRDDRSAARMRIAAGRTLLEEARYISHTHALFSLYCDTLRYVEERWEARNIRRTRAVAPRLSSGDLRPSGRHCRPSPLLPLLRCAPLVRTKQERSRTGWSQAVSHCRVFMVVARCCKGIVRLIIR